MVPAVSRRILHLSGCLAGLILPVLPAIAAEGEALRVIRDECLGCHKPGRAKGGLLLTDPSKLLAGGDSGTPAVVPGKADESPLYTLLLEEADPHMPPKKQLPPEMIRAVKDWINGGAKWDATVFDEPPVPREVKLAALPKGYQPIYSLALSPDGQTIALGRGNHLILEKADASFKAEVLDQWLAQPDPIQAVAWAADGESIFTAGFQRITRWEVPGQKVLLSLARSPLIGNVTALALSTDGRHLFAADAETGGSGFIHQFELPSGRLIRTWKAHDDTVYSMKLSPDGASLLTGGGDKAVRLWDLSTGKKKSEYEGHTNHVLSVAWHPDGSMIASTGADREIKVWNVKTGGQLISLGDKKSVYVALTWADAGKTLLATAEKGQVTVFTDLTFHDGAQRSDGAKERKLASVGEPLAAMTASSDGKHVFASGLNGNSYLWEAASGKLTRKSEYATSSP